MYLLVVVFDEMLHFYISKNLDIQICEPTTASSFDCLPDFPGDYQISIRFSIVGRMAICLLARLTPHVGRSTILPFPLVCSSRLVVQLSLWC